MKSFHALRLIIGVGALVMLSACSGQSVKKQEYAQLKNSRDFEFEYPRVWRGVVDALGDYKLEDKDQDKGYAKTDWIYSTSNDKYVEYQVNGFPRKRYLQTRYKMEVDVAKQVGGVKVTVKPEEEIENLKSDGSFDSWKAVSDFDTGRANELIRNIENKILSRPDALER